MVITWGDEACGRPKCVKGGQIHGNKWKLDFGGEHAIKYTDRELWSRTPEIYIVLFFFKRMKIFSPNKCSGGWTILVRKASCYSVCEGHFGGIFQKKTLKMFLLLWPLRGIYLEEIAKDVWVTDKSFTTAAFENHPQHPVTMNCCVNCGTPVR